MVNAPTNVCGCVVRSTVSAQYSLEGGPDIPTLAFIWIGFDAWAMNAIE